MLFGARATSTSSSACVGSAADLHTRTTTSPATLSTDVTVVRWPNRRVVPVCVRAASWDGSKRVKMGDRMAIIRVCTRQYKLGKVYIHQRRYWARLTIDSRRSMLATGLLSLAISSQHFGEFFWWCNISHARIGLSRMARNIVASFPTDSRRCIMYG